MMIVCETGVINVFNVLTMQLASCNLPNLSGVKENH